MTQDLDEEYSGAVLRAFEATQSALSLVNGIVHAPLQYIVGELWYTALPSTVTAINRSELMSGKLGTALEGHLFYMPEEAREHLKSGSCISPEDQIIVDKYGCRVSRVVADPVILDTHALEASRGQPAPELQAQLQVALVSIAQAVQQAGDTVVVTQPDASVSAGELPFQVNLHLYGWVGVLDSA